MKIKIIDLFVKIAKGEEVPEKIIAGDSKTEYYFDKELKDYINTRNQENLFEDEIGKFLKYYLNDEVEILQEEKKIPEKLPKWATTREDKEYTNIEYHVLEVSKKVDEIIDYLKSKGE